MIMIFILPLDLAVSNLYSKSLKSLGLICLIVFSIQEGTAESLELEPKSHILLLGKDDISLL